MKTRLVIVLCLGALSLPAQQKQTFDLATYAVPMGWQKINETGNVIGYAITNNRKGTYAQIAIYASTTSKGSLQADFESEWQELVVKTYNPKTTPQLTPAETKDGWSAQAGAAPFEFNGSESAAMLVTTSGYGRCMSIVVLTNTDEYQPEIQQFLESVDLLKPERAAQVVVNGNNPDSPSIIGTWGANSSHQSGFRVKNGVVGTISRQYTFNDNGTYSFVTKTFDPLMTELLLIKENGSYQISGDHLTINPQASVIESWSKKDGTDKWGNLLKTQNRTLEKVTYRFTKHFFTGIQEWNLVLQGDKETIRDGPFSSNLSYPKAWYYRPISATNVAIVLPGSNNVQRAGKVISNPSGANGFRFSTTSFDDGWTSTAQQDWVQVVKGNIVVLIHFNGHSVDVSSADHATISNNAWNTLVAPRYSHPSNYHVLGSTLGYERTSLISGEVTDNQTGKRWFVSLFNKGRSGWIEIICPDRQTFINSFGVDATKVDYYADNSIWNTLLKLPGYNKFAVDAADLKGIWSKNFSGATQYVNAYTGANAGMDTYSSNEKFEFGPGNTYKWNVGAASGFVGNIRYQSANSSGTFSLPNNWQIFFTDIEGKPKTFSAFFSCTNGGRILWLDDTGYGRVD